MLRADRRAVSGFDGHLMHIKVAGVADCDKSSMMRSYGFAPLSSEEIGPAYAVVRAIYPAISLEAWRAFARPLVGAIGSGERAIVGMRTQDGYLCGLFAYRLDGDFEHQRLLVVDPIVVLDLIDPEPVIRCMIRAIETTSGRLHCDATRIGVRGTHEALLNMLLGCGYAPEAQILMKQDRRRNRPEGGHGIAYHS